MQEHPLNKNKHTLMHKHSYVFAFAQQQSGMIE